MSQEKLGQTNSNFSVEAKAFYYFSLDDIIHYFLHYIYTLLKQKLFLMIVG